MIAAQICSALASLCVLVIVVTAVREIGRLRADLVSTANAAIEDANEAFRRQGIAEDRVIALESLLADAERRARRRSRRVANESADTPETKHG